MRKETRRADELEQSARAEDMRILGDGEFKHTDSS
ncbi:hypothetical protein BN3658_01974 [Coriobacteriaceae bacterium CHKCI002]|nr:hypothetical protein BN3658_01974 [Coriobacteriaceae bacterium CHKCI002]